MIHILEAKNLAFLGAQLGADGSFTATAPHGTRHDPYLVASGHAPEAWHWSCSFHHQGGRTPQAPAQ